MYEEKIFEESDIIDVNHYPENLVSSWFEEKLYEMTKNHSDCEHDRFYKISIERFDSEEELKNHQAAMDQLI